MTVAWWMVIGAGASTVVGVLLATRLARVRGGRRLPGRGSERSTSNVLRRYRRQGWRLLRNPTITHGREIDHIAVGPAGVVVVETTWRRSLAMNDLALAAKQAGRNCVDVESVLRAKLPSVAVLPVVVAWGRDRPDSVPAAIDGVRVVRGEALPSFLDRLPGGQLTSAEIRRVTECLTAATVEHDLYDRREHHIPAGCVAPEVSDSTSSAPSATSAA